MFYSHISLKIYFLYQDDRIDLHIYNVHIIILTLNKFIHYIQAIFLDVCTIEKIIAIRKIII